MTGDPTGVVVEPWGPEWNVVYFFFSRSLPRILLPHTKSAVDRPVSHQVTVARETSGKLLLTSGEVLGLAHHQGIIL